MEDRGDTGEEAILVCVEDHGDALRLIPEGGFLPLGEVGGRGAPMGDVGRDVDEQVVVTEG